MNKFTIINMVFFFSLIISFHTHSVFAADIPKKLEEVKYFLQVVDTPFWIWFFRISFCVCLLSIIISFFYYQNKEN
ncbi:hypothetical protein JOC70_003045 [Clostridium pascui]|uniref:hypothetical protein n=1 Tax=Clostridium pascui TaxID=46609 RepID=UPI00195D6F7F|nr:hypothetical protein [Clostridium pascui]MBM7871545.1 hypothetical protein [Clostridium pascui]